MRYGKFLPEKGTIGFVAPSFGCNIEPYKSAFLHAQEKWIEEGYQLSPGPNAYEGRGIGISNTPEKCAREFQEWYAKKDVDILISCGGGELMCEILPKLDFDKIKEEEPKWFMGYSDNTNLTFLLATLCDTAAVYGPCAAAFGMEPWHKSLQDAMEILRGERFFVKNYEKWEKEGLKSEENPFEPYHVTEEFRLHALNPQGEEKEFLVKGRLLGGCLDSLATLCGTRFDKVREFNKRYEEDGVLWFLEACDLNIMGIRRALWQLKNAGWFDTARGFLIGRPYCFGEEGFGIDQYTAVTDVLSELQVPIIMDLDIGHLPPMMPLVCGSLAKAEIRENSISIMMEYK